MHIALIKHTQKSLLTYDQTRGLLISADVAKPEIMAVQTYFILMHAEFTLSERQILYSRNHNLLKQQHSH